MPDWFDTSNVASNSLLWIVLLPLAGAIINGVFGRGANKQLTGFLAVGAVFGSFLFATYDFSLLLQDHERTAIVQDVYTWFEITVSGRVVPVQVRFAMDHLSGIMTVMVTGIATLIHLYSTSYMGDDPGYRRFMTYLNLFTASMLILVLASNIPLMFVGWEGVGVCSYLLIGFWWENPAYAAAGRKAFVVNRIGDFGVLIGTFLLVGAAGSFEFSEINAMAVELRERAVAVGGGPLLIGTGAVSIATLATLFLFLGCTGKSAQLPLYVWLPDAMAGPTPVSALIHAATMVTAGVYLTARLSPVFIQSQTTMVVIAIVGALTALMAASIGLVQNQMKKILAYSTVSQLGFMFAAVGVGAFSAGMFHVFTHAFFKACLFLGAGSVMHAVHAHGDADIRYLGGLRKYMPVTHATFAIACAAIAGVPLLSGFFSKDEILLGALEATQHGFPVWAAYTVFGILTFTAGLTAFYMFRLYFRTFWGDFKGGHPPDEHGHGHDDHGHAHEPHESETPILIALGVLAAGAVAAGYLGLPHWIPGLENANWWGHFLNGGDGHFGPVASWASIAVEHGEEGHHGMGFGPIAMALGTLAGVIGIACAYFWYGVGGWEGSVTAQFPAALEPAANPRFHRILMNKWFVDELYESIVVRPLRWLSVVAANIDRIAVDGLLTKVPGIIARGIGGGIARVQNGLVYVYGTVFVVGAAVLVWWFTVPHVDIEASTTDGRAFTFAAPVGAGYEYRWDFDADGNYDTDWSREAQVEHTYAADNLAAVVGFSVILTAPTESGRPIEQEFAVRRGESVVLPLEQIATSWQRADVEGTAVEPVVELGEDVDENGEALAPAIVIHTNGAAVRAGASDPEATTVRLAAGDTANIGNATLRVAVRARASLEVRNVFGNRAHASENLTLRVEQMTLEQLAENGAHR